MTTTGQPGLGDGAMRDLLLAASARVGGPLLGLDTSGPVTSLCSVAWKPQEAWETTLQGASLPSEALAAALAERFSVTGLRAHELRGIVVSAGPGSFTGLRVGLATAKGLAMGAGVPLVGVSSLAVLAASVGPGLVAPVLDARRGEVFSALYEVRHDGTAVACLDDAARLPEAFARAVAGRGGLERGEGLRLVGDFAERCVELPALARAEVVTRLPRIAHGILCCADRLASGDVDPVEILAPRYLRLSEAERQLAGNAAQGPP